MWLEMQDFDPGYYLYEAPAISSQMIGVMVLYSIEASNSSGFGVEEHS